MAYTEKELHLLLHQLLDLGEMLLYAGAEVNRVEDTLTRMGAAYGARKMNVFVITSSIVVTMSFASELEVTQTRRIVGAGATDFAKIEALNDLSRRCCQDPLPVEVLAQELERIGQPVRGWVWRYIGSVLAAGGFAVFFGGNGWDALVAIFFAVVICFLQRSLGEICLNTVIFNLLCSLVVGFGICGVVRIFPALHLDKIIIGDIMLLIPGIAMTNAIRDILVGDTISGLMRLIESLLWAGALACGFMAAIWLIGG